MSKEAMKQPEALRLAQQLTDLTSMFATPSHERGVCNGAIQELRRLHELHELYQDKVARLTASLKKANDQAEHFEREWYLRGDAIEDLIAVLRAFSDYVRDEQSSTDGAVTYSTTTVNHWAFLARDAIAKATGEKA